MRSGEGGPLSFGSAVAADAEDKARLRVQAPTRPDPLEGVPLERPTSSVERTVADFRRQHGERVTPTEVSSVAARVDPPER